MPEITNYLSDLKIERLKPSLDRMSQRDLSVPHHYSLGDRVSTVSQLSQIPPAQKPEKRTAADQKLFGWQLLGFLGLLMLGQAIIAPQAQAQATCTPASPDGSYATTGVNKNSTWWFNWECYNDSTASSTSGQSFTFNLPDGSTLSTTVKRTGPQALIAQTSPSWGGAAIGNGQYNGTTGKSVLYSAASATSTLSWQLSLSNIQVKDKSGNLRKFTVWVADGESTDSAPNSYNESLTFTTNGTTNWKLVELIPQSTSSATPTSSTSLAGTGTSTATWTAPRTNNNGSLILSTDNPTSITSASTPVIISGTTVGGKQGVFMGLGMPKVKVITNISGRQATADQFTTQISYNSPTVQIYSGSSTGTQSTFDNVFTSILPGNDITISETMAAGSTSTLSNYKSSISCSNANTSTTTLPSGNGTSFTLTPQIGDDITCTLSNAPTASISGTVFEDVNYGGGAGRDRSTASGMVRPNVRVELYDVNGNYLGKTKTDTNGQYLFNAANVPTFADNKTYQVRVVNSFVTSSRSGSCALAVDVDTPPATCSQSPVQTFRTNGLTGNVGTPDSRRVGGEKPIEFDAPANTTSQTLSTLNAGAGQEVQSLTSVTVGTNTVSGIDFGYNFDTIVNTNDNGQGSLRQFIINSNSLGGETSLVQVAQPAGYETSIFMIPNGVANPGHNTGYPNQLNTNGIAAIALTTTLPTISGPNTRLDGATQTANVKTAGGSETNPGQLGTGGTVGIDKISLPLFNRPEIEIKGQYTLTATGSYDEIKNIAFNAQRLFVSGNNSLVQDNLVGMQANGQGDATSAGVSNHGIEAGSGSNILISHNYVRVNESGIRRNNSGSNLTIEYNEVDLPSSGQTTTYDGILLIGSGSNDIVRNNLVKNMRGGGIELGFTGGTLTNTLVQNNTVFRNGYTGASSSTETMGVAVYSAPASQIVLSKNIITGSSGPGVVVMSSTGLRVTQNSIFSNGASGNGAAAAIDLDANTRDPNGYGAASGVTPNNGTMSASLPNGDMDYPIFTKVQRVGNNLELKGYIGTNPAGNSVFANATIEIYKADDDNNQNGEVIVGDKLSKPHGEGRYYIGTISTDAKGLFDTTLAIPASLTDGIGTTTLGATDRITSIATSSASSAIAPNSTSEFSENIPITVPVVTNPNILLVKRITAINGNPISTYTNDPDNPYDDNVIEPTLAPNPPNYPTADTNKWPNTPDANTSTFLLGSISSKVKPNDTIEYTIYFLSAGDALAKNVLFCDRVPDNISFITSAFPTLPTDTSGLAGNERGIAVNLGGTLKSYTNLADGDIAQYFPPGSDPKSVFPKINCGGNNTNGAIVVNLGDLPNAIAPGNPPSSYGFVRFQGRVK